MIVELNLSKEKHTFKLATLKLNVVLMAISRLKKTSSFKILEKKITDCNWRTGLFSLEYQFNQRPIFINHVEISHIHNNNTS